MLNKRIINKICNKITSDRGETLLELVTSIGIFAVTMLMLASMFAAANKMSVKNMQTEQDLDKAVTNIITESETESEERFTVSFETDNGKVNDKEVTRIGANGLYKFK